MRERHPWYWVVLAAWCAIVALEIANGHLLLGAICLVAGVTWGISAGGER